MTAEYNTIKPSKAGFLKRSLIYTLPFLCIIGFVFLGSIIIKLNNKPEEKKRAFNTLAVLADYAVLDDVQLSVKTQGEARPQTEIDLVPEVGGKIVYVSPNFIEGGIIKKGEVLLRIEDADYEVSVIRAQAQVAQAEQSLIRERAEGEIAKKDYQELGRGEASPLALRLPQQAQAFASLQAAEAELASANLQLKRTEVRAPFTGRVKTKNSDIGQFVSPGRTLGRIFSTSIVEVRLPLSDSDLSKLDLPIAYVAKNRASAIDVELNAIIAGKRRYWSGKIMRTASTYDTQTRALFAIAEVVDPYGSGASENGYPLAPGLFVDAEISGKIYQEIIVLPRDGLRPDNEVYVVDDKGKADIRKVKVLDSDSEKALLLGGVDEGELVVLSPMEKSRTSMSLRVLDVNNPETILVDPPKPDWMKNLEKKSKETKKKKKS
jgi:RND family efflux transporter MFP subunit